MTKRKASLANTALNTNGDVPVVEAISIEDAKNVLQLQQQKTVEACWLDLMAVLKKYNCSLEPEVIITTNNIETKVKLVAL